MMDLFQTVTGNDTINLNQTNTSSEDPLVVGSLQNVTVHMLDSGLKIEAVGPITIGDIGFAFCFVILLLLTYLLKWYFPKVMSGDQNLDQEPGSEELGEPGESRDP